MLDQETADRISAAIGTGAQFVAPLNPLIPVAITIVQQLIKAEPKIEATLKALLSKKETLTLQDFDDAIAHIQGTSYESLVPNADLPKDGTLPLQ
jgi:hypothetical protein